MTRIKSTENWYKPRKQELDEIQIIPLPKDCVPKYQFKETIKVNSMHGHIFERMGEEIFDLFGEAERYTLALSRSDHVTINGRDGIMFGFHRSTLEKLEALIEKFRGALPSTPDYRRIDKGKVLMTPIPYNTSIRWQDRVAGVILENVKSGEMINLTGKLRKDVERYLKFEKNPNLLHEILYCGFTNKHWRIKSKPLAMPS